MRLEPKNLFMGLLGSPIVGGVIMMALRPMFFGGQFGIQIEQTIALCLDIAFFLSFIGIPLLLVLTRTGWLKFLGFLGAGIVAGVLVVFICSFGHDISNRFPSEVTDSYLSYVFCTSILVSLLVWAISALSYLIDRLRGIERMVIPPLNKGTQK